MNRITLNGKDVAFQPGQTILEAARDHGVNIPTLCYLQAAGHKGVCRVCVVQVEGADRLLPACATPAVDGMVVETQSERVVQARKLMLELLVADGDHNCLFCAANGDCRLQDLVYEYGIRPGPRKDAHKHRPVDDTTPMILRNFNKCVLCGRCVTACNDIQCNNAIPYPYGRREEKPFPSGWFPLADYNRCVHCGECVQACPVGAIADRQALGLGRAWETEKVRTTCPYCGVGCQMWLHVKAGRIVRVTGVEDVAPNKGSLCVKGRYGHDFVHHPDRLTTPLIKEQGSFRKASWDEALTLVAERLNAIKSQAGPDSLAFFSSARCSNEENYLMNKLARGVVGTNNVDHCARLCHASTVAGLAVSFGSGAMTNSIEELERSDVVLVTGSNTTETHPVISTYLKRGVKKGKTKLILVEPRRIDLVDHAEVWLRQKPGTDIAWLNGMMHVIVNEQLYAKEYISERTEGFEDLKKAVAEYTPERVERITGIPAQDLIMAARLYAEAPAASVVYAMGITQHINGTDTVKSVANLSMLCGNVGIESGGVNPLRGQNNVQGACDMGALPNVFSGYQAVTTPEVRDKMAEAWKVSTLPSKVGLTVVEVINAAAAKQIKGLYIMGENPMMTDPDINHVREGLKALDFLVVQDIFLTETCELADVVLPSCCFAEKEGTFTNTERRVQRVRKAVEPPGEALPDWGIISRVATCMGYEMTYPNPRAIFDEMAQVTPSYAGMDYQRLDGGGLQWPCPTKDHPGTKYLHRDRFVRGKGLFHGIAWLSPAEETDAEYPLILTTGRVLYHYHSGSMTRRCEGLNDRCPECLVGVNTKDASVLNISDGEPIRVVSRRGEINAKASVSDVTDEGTVFIPFHFVESAANKLTIAALDPICKIPEYKVCAVKLEKVG